MQKFEHNLTANTSGALRPLSGASVTVTDNANGLPAALYSDNGATPLAQPLTTDNTGYFGFYAADGKYTLTFSGPRFATFTREILLEDPADNPSLTAQELALVNGSSKVGFSLGTPGSVAQTVEDVLRERVSVTQFGAIGIAVLNLAIAAVADGTLTIPAGSYDMTGDIIIKLKGDANTGGFKLDATGVVFTGSGRIIVDSCKRLTIEGLDAPNHDLHWRGAWWCEFIGMRYRKLVMGDAVGTSFSSTSWNSIRGGQSQSVVLHANAASYYNEVVWDAHSMRGSADQAFTATAAYAFEFNGNVNAQSWKFNGGDISYHTAAIYRIDPANTTGDIELVLDGVYLDTLVPASTPRDDARIVTRNCHHANGAIYAATLAAATAGAVDMFRADRSMRHDASTSINLIPNGDFKDRLTTWAGGGLPIWSLNSSVLTATDGGISGTCLNLNQSLTTGNSIRFRPKPLPYAGRATATIVLRNKDVGTKTMAISVFGLSPTFTINDTDWTVARITASKLLAAGTTNDLQLYTNDGTPFNVDVAYVGITMGEGAALVLPSNGFRTIDYNEAYNFPSIAAGAYATKDFTIPGVALGDFALASTSVTLGELQMVAAVTATDTVRIFVKNNTGAAIDLGGIVYYLRVWKRGYV